MRLFGPSRGDWLRIPVLVALAAGCTLDGVFFSPERVDAYRFDEPGSELEGTLSEPHPSLIGPDDRTEGFLELDGEQLYYVFARRQGASDAILYSYGAEGHLGRHWDRVERLWELGYHVMAYDYPGYGRSRGRLGEGRLYEAGAAVLARLVSEPDVDPTRLWLYGYSLGGAVAYELAARAMRGSAPSPRGIITESAFCSAEALLEDGSFLDLEDHFVTDLRLDSCSKIRDIPLPILILHGTADDFIVPRHARMLADRAIEAELVLVEDATHSDVPEVLGARYGALLRGMP